MTKSHFWSNKKGISYHFYWLKAAIFIGFGVFLPILTKCTSTASIILICTEKPLLTKRLHALYRVLFYLRTILLKNLRNTCTKHKKAKHKLSTTQKKGPASAQSLLFYYLLVVWHFCISDGAKLSMAFLYSCGALALCLNMYHPWLFNMYKDKYGNTNETLLKFWNTLSW